MEPYKGARDFYPNEMRIRNYIFDIWRETALSFGYEEYDFPFIERYELYAEKSGEDLVKNQLYDFEDKGGRKVAIRPEKTPSLARMVAAKINALSRPIRWFNIGNCWRYEKPQKGRGREFFQFDCDIFGVDGVAADVEVFSIPVEVMLRLGATKDMFEIRVANRKLAEDYFGNEVKLSGMINKKGSQMNKVAKIVDSINKISQKEFEETLEKEGLNTRQVEKVSAFVEADLGFLERFSDSSEGAKETLKFFKLMEEAGYRDYFKFRPDIMRQFDYSTGIVIEQFDLNPKNNRAMFGGERYSDLINLFTDVPLSGTGFAMGDMTLLEFLRGWNLVPDLIQEVDYLVTLWPSDSTKKNGGKDNKYMANTLKIARKLREKGNRVITWLEPGASISQQLSYASKKGVKNVIIRGDKEAGKGTVSIKNMATGEQKEVNLEEQKKNLSSRTVLRGVCPFSKSTFNIVFYHF